MEDKVKIKVDHLTKKFGDLLVLDDISFEVKKGELKMRIRIYCIFAPNYEKICTDIYIISHYRDFGTEGTKYPHSRQFGYNNARSVW